MLTSPWLRSKNKQIKHFYKTWNWQRTHSLWWRGFEFVFISYITSEYAFLYKICADPNNFTKVNWLNVAKVNFCFAQ